MPIEAAFFIADLTTTNPPGTDDLSQGDDHFRLLKTVLQASLPGFAGVVAGRGAEAQGAGTVSQYTVTITPAPTVYGSVTGGFIAFFATHDCTAAPQLQIGGLGYKSLKDANGRTLAAAAIKTGDFVLCSYNGTDFLMTRTGGADVQTFSGSGTWTKPPGNPKLTIVELLGAGGGGGGGARGIAGSNRGGGSAGGGGVQVRRIFLPSALGATEAVTIGAGGTAGALVAVNGVGNNGNVGGNSTFGALATAYGGGAGFGGRATAAAISGGNGAGSAAAGAAGSTSSGAGANPTYGTATTGNANGEGGAAGATSTAGGHGEWGGGAGGGVTNAQVSTVGGGSMYGGAGGGSGGGVTAADASTSGRIGGTTNSYATANTTDGAGGVAGGNGTPGAAVTGYLAGSAGGGGGGGTGGVGGTGGLGAAGSGGGGGGASTGANSGAGGDGGPGACRVTTVY